VHAGNKVLQAAGIMVQGDYAASGVYRLDAPGISDLMQTTCALGALKRDAAGTAPLSAAERRVRVRYVAHCCLLL
jgi:hypothetical protein